MWWILFIPSGLMTSLEEHKRKIDEHLEELGEAIDAGIEKRPIAVGFHCSACSIEMLEVYLHKLNKISIGKVIKHDWFKPIQEGQKVEPLAERMIGAEFSRKTEIFSLIHKIEAKRDKLIYGKPSESEIRQTLENFNKLKKIFLEELKKFGVELE